MSGVKVMADGTRITAVTVSFDDMAWPRTDDPKAVEYALRYGTPTREQLLVAASYVSAYRQLIAITERERRHIVRKLRAADGGGESG